MVPLAQPANADLAGIPVLILSGAQDPIVPAANAARLTAQLRERAALVEQRILSAGHGLTNKDVELTANWFETLTATT
jgi:phospholipase/carboxylesterase